MMEVIYREEKDRWLNGDRHIRPAIRRLIRGDPTQVSGMQRVVRNFLKGLGKSNRSYRFNTSSIFRKRSSKIISFGLGAAGVAGLHRENPVIAAIGFPYPSEFPDLCEKYNVRRFLQHSQWALDLVKSANIYDANIFDLWPAGIDVDEWLPRLNMADKEIDVLLYNKIHWDRDSLEVDFVRPIKDYLSSRNVTFKEIQYGHYTAADYQRNLAKCRVMMFIAEHETQGLAYQECLASDVPVIAWDPGFWVDPDRFRYNRPIVPATSVPYFDERCGLTFKTLADFAPLFDEFFDRACSGAYSPREYVRENLSIEKSTARMLEIFDSI